MDKVVDSGSTDAGSIPVRGAKRIEASIIKYFGNLYFLHQPNLSFSANGHFYSLHDNAISFPLKNGMIFSF